MPTSRVLAWTILIVLPLLGLCYWALEPRDRRGRNIFLLGLAAVLSQAFIEVLISRLARLDLPVYDLYVYHVDGLFGFEPSFAVARWFVPHPWVMQAIDLAYWFMPVAVPLTLAALIWHHSMRMMVAVRAFLLCVLVSPLLYLMFPVCGPRFAFPEFPVMPARVPLAMIHLRAPPNGIPSVHMAMALLIVFFCWRRRLSRALSLAFAVATAIATLVTGQHYSVDLLLGALYAMLILWLAGAFRTMDSSGYTTSGS